MRKESVMVLCWQEQRLQRVKIQESKCEDSCALGFYGAKDRLRRGSFILWY